MGRENSLLSTGTPAYNMKHHSTKHRKNNIFERRRLDDVELVD
jgi:hypothetical protein